MNGGSITSKSSRQKNKQTGNRTIAIDVTRLSRPVKSPGFICTDSNFKPFHSALYIQREKTNYP